MGTSEKKFARRFMSLNLIQKRGEVRIYKAVHAFRGVEVFLKIARKAATDTQIESRSEAQRKLHLEALATDRVVHPNVVRVIDAGLGPKHETFVATEYLHGQDLADRIDKRGRISVPKALSVGIAVARALCVAHRKGVIHGDIKPSNIFLLSEECEDDLGVKLLDFGCAFASDLTGLRAERKASGTPGYMCPAYSATGILSERSDIFSLGVTLYEALSVMNPLGTEGRFEISDSSLMLRERKRRRATPLCELVPTVPYDLSSIIDRAMAHDPARRIGSARELLRALEQVRDKLHHWAGPGLGYGVGDDSPTAPFGLPTALRALDLMTASREAIVGLASGTLRSPSLELDPDAPADPACDFRPTPFDDAARRICAPLELDLDEAGDLPADAVQPGPPIAHSELGAGASHSCAATSGASVEFSPPITKQTGPAPASAETPVSEQHARPQSDDVTPVVGVPCGSLCSLADLRDSAAPAAEQTRNDAHATPPSGVSAPTPPPDGSARDGGTAVSALADDLDSGWAAPSPEHESKAPPAPPAAPPSETPAGQVDAVAALDPAVAIREALACEDSTPPSCSAIVRALDAETSPEGIRKVDKGSESRPSQSPAIGLVVAGDTNGGLFVRAITALTSVLPWFGRQGWLEARSTATGPALWAPHRPDAFGTTSDPVPPSRPAMPPSRMLTLWSSASSALQIRTHIPAALGTPGQSTGSPAVQTLSCGTMARRSAVFHAPVRTAELIEPDTTPFGTFAALPQYVGRHAQAALVLVAPATISVSPKVPESGKFLVSREGGSSAFPCRPHSLGTERPARSVPSVGIGQSGSKDRRRDARIYGGVPICRPPDEEGPSHQPSGNILAQYDMGPIARRTAIVCGGVAATAAMVIGAFWGRPVQLPRSGARAIVQVSAPEVPANEAPSFAVQPPSPDESSSPTTVVPPPTNPSPMTNMEGVAGGQLRQVSDAGTTTLVVRSTAVPVASGGAFAKKCPPGSHSPMCTAPVPLRHNLSANKPLPLHPQVNGTDIIDPWAGQTLHESLPPRRKGRGL